jgi:AcrR family transcriptional regulator
MGPMANIRRPSLSQPTNLNRAVLIESVSMPRPRARLDPAAVTRAFAPDGLHGATSAAIARSAGVAKPTVYAHGGSKEAVFLACVEAEVERLLSEISAADLRTRSFPARARIAALAESVIEHGRERPEAARLLHVTARHTASGVASDVDAALARLPAHVAQVMRRDTTPDCAERVAPAFLGAAAALALTGGVEPAREGSMLGDAFAGVLEPIEAARGADSRIQNVGLY